MIPKADAPIEQTSPPPTAAFRTHSSARSAAESCARIKELGFTASKHITIYGERLELVSDPFEDGGCTAVQVVSKNDPTIRTLRLPEAILVGLSDQFRKPVKLPARPAPGDAN